MNDEDLVREFRKGDTEAFSELVRRHSKPLTMMILKIVRDSEEARDISQAALLKAYESLPRFLMASSFKTWLYRIALNAVKDYLRKRKPQTFPDVLDDLPNRDPPAPDQLDKARYLERLRSAIEELPEKQRLTLQLRIYEEMNYKAIADVLGGTEGSARVNFFQATKTLREKLGSTK